MTLLCDFCRATGPVAALPASDHVYVRPEDNGGIGVRSLGAWAACPACQALIGAGDREGLADRAMPAMRELLPGAPDAGLRRALMVIQDGFFRSRADGR